ncbi:phospholipid/cholesterol/gamma-HCH transport system substrate-binding protein [Rhodococcus sp. 27YEA15]|uniref:MCE family protein n=1 Tax=Rhodococcus sp. 27YEA15 TaxID=3156259 RepID=UPI003C7E097B
MTSTARKIAALAVIALCAIGAIVYYVRPDHKLIVTAEFASTDAIFAGNKVTILGVPSGRVERVVPDGSRVRVEVSLPAGTRVPADVQAWVLSPSVISDRTVELGPGYESGDTLSDGAVIPLERTHSPLTWDQLTSSVNDLLVALGPGADGGGIGDVVGKSADLVDGNGESFRNAVQSIARASSVLAGAGPDMTELVGNLNTLVQTIADNQTQVNSLSNSITATAQEFSNQRENISGALNSVTTLLGQVSALLSEHGSALTDDMGTLAQLTGSIATKQDQLREVVDTAPTGFQNVANLVTDDGRARVRLNVGTNLSQFDSTRALCQQMPLPICTGPGLVNPIEFPVASDDSDLARILGGVR